MAQGRDTGAEGAHQAAADQVGLAGQVIAHGHALPQRRRFLCQRCMGEIQMTCGLRVVGMGGEPGGPGLAVLIVMQQAMTHQVTRALEAAEVEQPRAAHRKKLQQRQGPDEVGAGIQRTGAIGDGDINIGSRRACIDGLLVQVQGDMRVAAAEIGQPRHQPLLRELGGDRQAQHCLGRRIT
ncbi:hypothetical protein D3C77_516540 [compost metagenome]